MNTSECELLAYRLWQQRGMPVGSPEEDWFVAEELLKKQEKQSEPSKRDILFPFGMERSTR